MIVKLYPEKTDLSIHHPKSKTVTYLVLNNDHLQKLIQNLMLNTKKFVSPAFFFNINDEIDQTDAGYIALSDHKFLCK